MKSTFQCITLGLQGLCARPKKYLDIFNLHIFLIGNNTFQIRVTDPRFLLTSCVGKDRQVK